MIQKPKKLLVKYNDKIVGYLVELENGQIAFQYSEEWIKNGFSISPFSLPLSNKIFINKKQTFNGLYGVFWDSLPDGWSEILVRRILRKDGIDFDKLTSLEKLTLISNKGLGAINYEPCEFFDNKELNYNLDEIVIQITKILNDEIDKVNLDEIYKLGGSSGGARPKVHITINGEEWIIKFPCLIDPKNIGEQEYKANIQAKKCGINVNDFELFNSEICTGYFGAKRFDRKNKQKIHMISLSALLETTHKLPNLDYFHLFQVIQNICKDKTDLYEAFRRMCFNVLYGNKDDHSKNFSFLYDEDTKSYKLSPAYDITRTPNKLEHEMTVNGNGNPTEKDLLEIANKFNLSKLKCKDIINNIKKVISENSK